MSYVTVFIVESATEKYVNKLVASVTQMTYCCYRPQSVLRDVVGVEF